MITFVFDIGTAPAIDVNRFEVDVHHESGHILVSGNLRDAILSGLFRQAARIRSCVVYFDGICEHAVPAYRWYGQRVMRCDSLYRNAGRYHRILRHFIPRIV